MKQWFNTAWTQRHLDWLAAKHKQQNDMWHDTEKRSTGLRPLVVLEKEDMKADQT